MSGIEEALAKKQKRLADKNAAMAAAQPRRTVPDELAPGLEELLTDVEVGRIFRIGRSTVWRRVAAGLLPKPIEVGPSTRWRGREIAALIEAAIARRDAGEVRVNVSIEAAAAAKRARKAAAAAGEAA